MSAERKPPANARHLPLLARLLLHITRAVLRYPVAAVSIGLGLALGSLVLTFFGLGYKSSRLDLLNPNSDYNRLWIEYIQEFGDDDDAVIVVEGTSRDQVVPVLQELSALLSRDEQLFRAILHEVDLTKIRAKGLHYVASNDLAGMEQFLQGSVGIVQGQWAQLKVGTMLGNLTGQLQGAMQAAQNPIANSTVDPQQAVALAQAELQRFTEGLLAGLHGQQRRYLSPWPGMPESLSTISELGSEYLLNGEGKLGFVLLRLAPGDDKLAPRTEAIDALRKLIEQSRLRHPEAKIGLTGLPVMENDEMRASQSSMLWAGILSLIGVAIVTIAGFGGVRHALLANLVLLIGMAWAFGYVTLTVGHLNILSVTFTATLIGIGIDFGTYYAARYMQLRREGQACREAILEAMGAVGPGISTGALTTAIAFFAAGLTSFTGVSELGIIAGGGILLCAVAQLVLLPGFIYLVDRNKLGQRIPEPVPVHALLAPLMRMPRAVFAAGIAASVFLAMGLPKLWYDHNLLNMQPIGLESVELERKLLDESDQSVWYALSIADSREALLQRKQQFLALPSVERTEEIVSMLPVDHELKQPVIQRIDAMLTNLPERPPLISVDSLDELGQRLAQAQNLVSRVGGGANCARQIEQIRERLRSMQPAECFAALSQFQQSMAGDLLSRLHALKGIANPNPPRLNDLPQSLVDRFVGHNGRHLLKIYGKGNIWDIESLGQFVHDVRTVDVKVTGNPLQAYEASLEMKQSYQHAALYATIVIAIVLWLDFRSVWLCLFAMFPLALSMVQTFGLMGLLNIPLNPANLIALPLIVGLGVDYGVHIVHNFLEQPGPYRMTPATAIAVMVDAVTTIIGFGSLMIASHQGLQSLGRVLTIGITCCLITSLVLLPALLTWLTRNRAEVDTMSNQVVPRDLLAGSNDDRRAVGRRVEDAHYDTRPA